MKTKLIISLVACLLLSPTQANAQASFLLGMGFGYAIAPDGKTIVPSDKPLGGIPAICLMAETFDEYAFCRFGSAFQETQAVHPGQWPSCSRKSSQPFHTSEARRKFCDVPFRMQWEWSKLQGMKRALERKAAP